MKTIIPLVIALSTLLLLAGCFPRSHHFADDSPAGFFSGIWHGWIAPISLIAGFFNDNIRLYEPHNTGWWYDLGFYVAVISGFGGISLFRRTKKGGKERE